MRDYQLVTVDSSFTRQAPEWMSSGGWYRVRLQVFPDGTCGLALDGQPVWRSTVPTKLLEPIHVVIYGQTVETQILVGPIEVWRGVKTDVDWGLLLPRRCLPHRVTRPPRTGV